MKPMYFPFTRISKSNAAAISRRLGPFSICREVTQDSFGDAADSNGISCIEPVCPVADGSGRITALAEQYLKWGNLHKNDMAVLNRFGSAAFYNDEFVANISTQIKKNNDRKSDADDSVLMARLFLNLARRFDMREDEVLREIKAAENTGRSLVAELTGIRPEKDSGVNLLGNAGPPGDSGAVATETRLTSFFRLICQQAQLPHSYVTSSRAVMESLVDRFSGITLLSRIDGVPECRDVPEPSIQVQPKWIRDLFDLALIHDNAAVLRDVGLGFSRRTGSEDGYRMEIYAVDACPPASFVSELAGMPCTGLDDTDFAGLTLIFLITDYMDLQRAL